MREDLAKRGIGLLVESLVVIVSILVAFGLDAWWEERVARQELRGALASVVEELETNVAALEVEALFHRTAVASIDDLVARIDQAGDDPWLAMPDTIASFAFVFPPVFDASTGALAAFVASGWLSEVRDPRLKRILGNLPAQIEDVQDGEMGARRLAIEELVPLFWEDPDLEFAFGRSGEYRDRGLEQIALPSRTIRLRNVDGLRNRLLHRRAWVISSQRGIGRLRADLDAALEMLRVELDGGGDGPG